MHVSTIVLIAASLGAGPVPDSTTKPTSSASGREHTTFRQLGQGWTTGSPGAGQTRYTNGYSDPNVRSAAQTGAVAGERAETSVLTNQNGMQNGRLIERPNYARATGTVGVAGTPDRVAPPELVILPSSDPNGGAAGSSNVQTNAPGYGTSDPGRNPFDNRGAVNNGPILTGGDYRNQSNAPQGGVVGTTTPPPPTSNPLAANSGMVPVGTVRSGYAGDRGSAGAQQTSNSYPSGGYPDPRYTTDYSSPVREDREPRQSDGLGAWQGNYNVRDVGTNPPLSNADRGPGTYGGPGSTTTQVGQTNGGLSQGYGQSGMQSQLPQNQPPPVVGGLRPPASTGSIDEVVSGPTDTPWIPLVMTGVFLMGSLGANLFLGFSYLDARHKYLTAVRRGSRSFARTDVAA